MANGHLTYRPATGHLAYSSNGHLALNCASNPCEYCPDSTPSQYDVTFDGVTMCTDCASYAVGWGTVSFKVVSGELDGTYRLTQDAVDPCLWRGTASFVGRYWTVGACAGAAAQEVTDLRIELSRSSGTFSLLVRETADAPPGPGWVLFDGSASSTNCASGLPTINNIYTECETDPFLTPIEAAYGGTATLALV